MLDAYGTDIWTYAAPLDFPGGIQLGTRTTVVRLPSGGLWVHSPCRMSDALGAEVDALGPVEHLVAPNLFHHLFLNQWRRRYPNASVHIPRGLEAKREDLRDATFLGDEPDPAWGGVLELVAIGGSPKVNEVIFLHKPSRTLIVCDLMMQVLGNVSFLSRVMWKLNGVYGHAGRSFVSKRLLRDPSAAHAGVERVRSWEFDRILLAHRDSVDQDGKRVFLRAFEGL